jgi:soluble lytic murein transglycosylase-like protein/uncharacterized membrane protein YeaQ/YmgE (transglycosylase-associated protein family)
MNRRYAVYRIFLTGILIGLFFVVIVSDNASKLIIFSPDRGIIDQSVLVLTFSGILGGVLYTIMVDGIVEMPRFVGKGESFEAGLFGDILLGIAGAFILEFLTSSVSTTENSSIVSPYVLLAAKGMIGGYGSKALMNMALQKFLGQLEEEKKSRKEAEAALRDVRKGQQLLDQISRHIKDGLPKGELEELQYGIQQSSDEEREHIFKLTKEFRHMGSRSEVLKTQIQRMIPIFDALVSSNPDNHAYHAQLAYACKDAAYPDFQAAIDHLNQAIALRGDAVNLQSTWKYELNRAIATIQQNYKERAIYQTPELVTESITQDLLTVIKIHPLDSILKDAQANHIPTPIQEWIQHNQGFLTSHRDAALVLQQMQQPLNLPVSDSAASASPPGDQQPSDHDQSSPEATAPPVLANNSALGESQQPHPSDSALPEPSSSDSSSSDSSAPETLPPSSSEPSAAFTHPFDEELNHIRAIIDREVTGVLSIQDWTPDLYRAIKDGLVYLGFLKDNDDFEAFQVGWAQFKASVDRGGTNRIGKDSAALFLDALERRAVEPEQPLSTSGPLPPAHPPISPLSIDEISIEENGSSTPEITDWDDVSLIDMVSPPIESDQPPSAAELAEPSVSRQSFTWHSRWDAILHDVPTTGASALTSKQDRLAFNGLLASNQMARKDSPDIEKLIDRFCRAAAKYEVPAPVLAAIASRESRCGKMLDANGMGDHGNAFGIMQIDKRHHTPAGLGGDPASQAHIDQSAEILADNLKRLQSRFPEWEETYLLKAAIAAYNFGTKNVHTKEGIDQGTTGDDYGSDVIARAKFYTALFNDVNAEVSFA